MLRSACFMEPEAYSEKLEALNAELAKLPAAQWKGKKIVTSGIICDGAKPSCAAKIASSVEAGILGYLMHKNGQDFKGGDGILADDVDNTVSNVGVLARKGMLGTDRTILSIMVG